MLTKLSSPLFKLTRWQKRGVMLCFDALLLAFAVWAAFALRCSSWQPPLGDGERLLFIAPIITIPIFIRLGLYRAVVRYISAQPC